MRAWSITVSADRFSAARLYHDDVLELDDIPAGPAAGDRVALITPIDGPAVFALARVAAVRPAPAGPAGRDGAPAIGVSLVLAYTHRFLDAPRPTSALAPARGGLRELDPATLDGLEKPNGRSVRQRYLVSLDIPIEAATPAEAVREFWTYVRDLGPAELPAFVSPAGNELAMQAFVLGEEANQDPEED